MATTCSPLCKHLVFKTFASSLDVSGYNGKFIIADNFHVIVVICCCYGGFEVVVELFYVCFAPGDIFYRSNKNMWLRFSFDDEESSEWRKVGLGR